MIDGDPEASGLLRFGKAVRHIQPNENRTV